MRGTRLALALAAAVWSAACGEGRAVFNIDVFSFLQSSKVDTIRYFAPLPAGVPDTIVVQRVQLLPIGLGNSVVDSVRVTATLDFVNATGTGTVGFAIYVDSVPGVYSRPPVFQLAPVNVSGTNTSPAVIVTDLAASLLPLFNKPNLYVGTRVTATATSPPVTGVAKVKSLDLRIVMQDQIF